MISYFNRLVGFAYWIIAYNLMFLVLFAFGLINVDISEKIGVFLEGLEVTWEKIRGGK